MMSKYKVACFVFNSFVNDSRVLKEATTLSKMGMDVTVFAHLDEGLNKQEVLDGVAVIRLSYLNRKVSTKFSKLKSYLFYVIQAIKKTKHFNVLHCNDLNTLPIGYLIKTIFNRKMKIVYDAHEYEINDIPNQSLINIKLKFFLEKFLIKCADKVITVSDSIANEYSRLYKIEKPYLVLNTPAYKHMQKEDIFRDIFGIGKEKTIFLYQGGLGKGRGIEILLNTFMQIENKNYVIIFMGYGELSHDVMEAQKNYKNIFFHKAVSPLVLLEYTGSADVGILFYENNCLNHNYCSPNKMFEYLMAEIPVIVSNLFEMKRLVDINQIGVVAQENTVSGLTVAINKIVNIDFQNIQENIKKTKLLYNWEEQEKVLKTVYKEWI